jgi:hypothetical protein
MLQLYILCCAAADRGLVFEMLSRQEGLAMVLAARRWTNRSDQDTCSKFRLDSIRLLRDIGDYWRLSRLGILDRLHTKARMSPSVAFR